MIHCKYKQRKYVALCHNKFDFGMSDIKSINAWLKFRIVANTSIPEIGMTSMRFLARYAKIHITIGRDNNGDNGYDIVATNVIANTQSKWSSSSQNVHK